MRAVQLLKQTRGNPDSDSAVRAWMMMLLTAATAPPGKEFVGIVSEYVHSMSHNESEVPEEIRAWAMRTWAALKRTAKAGSRQSVRTRPLVPRCRCVASEAMSPSNWTQLARLASSRDLMHPHPRREGLDQSKVRRRACSARQAPPVASSVTAFNPSASLVAAGDSGGKLSHGDCGEGLDLNVSLPAIWRICSPCSCAAAAADGGGD